MDVGPDKRERILAAASDLIVRNGLQCSMAAIADAAGVATGSIYNYFASKDDMILAVYDRLSSVIAEKLVTRHPGTGPREKLERYIEDYIDFIWEDRDRAILFEYLSNVPLIPIEKLHEAFAPVAAFTAEVVSGAREAGLLRDFSIDFMGGFIGGGIRNTLKWRRADPAPLAPEERRQIALMCWDAIAARPGT